jgi:hypothetical protein
MGFAPPRFTIGSLMIVVALVGGVLGLYQLVGSSLLLAILGLLYLSLIGVWWWMFRGFRRLSALTFASTTLVANAACFAVCIYLLGMAGSIPGLLIWLALFPLILGAGSAWAVESTRRNAVRRHSTFWVWPLVLGAAIAPLPMLYSFWPLQLAFRVSRSALERLADRVAAGQVLADPEWAGICYVVGSDVDPASGNVALITDSDPSGRSGFVRTGPGVVPTRNLGPFYSLWFCDNLGGRWFFQTED